MPTFDTIGEDFPKEQARVRELLTEYEKIPMGAFAAIMIKDSLKKAEEAAMSDDIVKLLVAYEDLKGIS